MKKSKKHSYELINEMCNGVLRGKYHISDDDFISDAVLKICLQFDKSQTTINHLKKWLNGAIYNHFCNYVVKKMKNKTSLNLDEIEEKYALNNDDKTHEYLNECVNELPNRYSKVLQMKIYGGLSYNEISEHMDITPIAARKQYSRSLMLLKDSFK